MKVTVRTSYEYRGKDEPTIETFDLEVEGDLGDVLVAEKYLELRKILKEGIKEE